MDEFTRAQRRFERRAGTQVMSMGEKLVDSQPEPRPILKLPKKKEETGRTNEIEIAVFLAGNEYTMTFHAPMSSTLMSGQINRASLTEVFQKLLSQQFGKVTLK